MSARTAPKGYVWVSCSREVGYEFGRWRHLIPERDIHQHWVTTVCQGTGAGVGTFRRDYRKPYCRTCETWARGFNAASKGGDG